SQFLTDTRGTGILNHNFKTYGPFAGNLRSRPNGVLISQDDGETNTYGLFYLQERGQLFMGPQIKVYAGQIIGLHSRDNDLIVNPSKAKKLTNIRTTAADEKLFLTPPRVFTLESALEFINDDELVEVTPSAIRLRKRALDHNERKRLEKLRDAAGAAGGPPQACRKDLQAPTFPRRFWGRGPSWGLPQWSRSRLAPSWASTACSTESLSRAWRRPTALATL